MENLSIPYIVVAQVFYSKRVMKAPAKHETLLMEMALAPSASGDTSRVYREAAWAGGAASRWAVSSLRFAAATGLRPRARRFYP